MRRCIAFKYYAEAHGPAFLKGHGFMCVCEKTKGPPEEKKHRRRQPSDVMDSLQAHEEMFLHDVGKCASDIRQHSYQPPSIRGYEILSTRESIQSILDQLLLTEAHSVLFGQLLDILIAMFCCQNEISYFPFKDWLGENFETLEKQLLIMMDDEPTDVHVRRFLLSVSQLSSLQVSNRTLLMEALTSLVRRNEWITRCDKEITIFLRALRELSHHPWRECRETSIECLINLLCWHYDTRNLEASFTKLSDEDQRRVGFGFKVIEILLWSVSGESQRASDANKNYLHMSKSIRLRQTLCDALLKLPGDGFWVVKEQLVLVLAFVSMSHSVELLNEHAHLIDSLLACYSGFRNAYMLREQVTIVLHNFSLFPELREILLAKREYVTFLEEAKTIRDERCLLPVLALARLAVDDPGKARWLNCSHEQLAHVIILLDRVAGERAVRFEPREVLSSCQYLLTLPENHEPFLQAEVVDNFCSALAHTLRCKMWCEIEMTLRCILNLLRNGNILQHLKFHTSFPQMLRQIQDIVHDSNIKALADKTQWILEPEVVIYLTLAGARSLRRVGNKSPVRALPMNIIRALPLARTIKASNSSPLSNAE